MSVSCVECHEIDHPLRIVPVSYCEHRVCMEFRRNDCAPAHYAACPTFCAAVGRTPGASVTAGPVQLDLFERAT